MSIKCPSENANKKFIVLQAGSDGESFITEGLRTALARLRQKSTPSGSQSSPFQQPISPSSHSENTSENCSPSSSPSPRPRMTVSSQSGPRSPRPSEDLFTTATSALRRLHFKSGRTSTKNATKSQGPVPKVIVMGSSTTSETTLNTSTDSSNTIVTTMTVTDGDNTEDSLDITEPVDILNTENNMVTNQTPNEILQPTPMTPNTPSTARKETKFSFDVESPPKTAYCKAEKFVFDMHSIEKANREIKNVDTLMQEQVEALRQDARRRNSYRAAQNTLDSIDVAYDNVLVHRRHSEFDYSRANHDNIILNKERRSHRRKIESSHEDHNAEKLVKEINNKCGRSSPKLSKLDQTVDTSTESQDEITTNKPKQKHKRTTKRHSSPNKHKGDKFSYDEKHIAKYREKNRLTPPDLRVDFFNEQPEKSHMGGLIPVVTEKRGSVCLNKCLRELGTQFEPNLTSPINVTTNPMENSLRIGVRKTPQATIVVQQPSLSLDQSNISTVLLRNGSEFVSNVESAGNKLCIKKQREDHMKQLLDVSNNLTLEEIHDFEMRYGSPHHSRSQSVKTPGRSSGRPNYLCLPQQRSRVASMPNTGVEEEYYRLRHFSITGKGVVNRGDSLKSRRSRSNNSVASSNSSTEQLPGPTSAAGSARTSASCSLASSRESSTSAPTPVPYKVLMLGDPAVGKSSLVSQFMTSEYLHAYDTSIAQTQNCGLDRNDESGEKSVSVLLAGEESELTFIDFATADLSPESCINKYSDPHAYCVVYSSADRSSLACAERILQNLWTSDNISTKAVILVANKADLVRSRVVPTEEGKLMATAYDCKYIETSVGINHNVDELLVGILTQIRLKLENPEKTRDIFRKRSTSKRNLNRNRSPVSGNDTPTGSAQNSPKKCRGTRTSASLKVRNLLGKGCENLFKKSTEGLLAKQW
ncbi:hypothetical protein RN001_001025 [Aquatica leii]|uniref:GTP-binding protein REM 1 n=1 Tax=Aquatica leii TaxID=1421715 RepID=A0AAN7PFN1_9COLE|nr:hypothetical protein RN001_001025 [Aquatica leii]